MDQLEPNNYWIWNNEIPHETCQKIIELGENKWQPSETNKSYAEHDGTSLKNIRQSNTIWLTAEWLHELIAPYIQGANNSAGWKYDISAVEDMQLTKYMENGFYSWHVDSLGCHNSIINFPDTAAHGKVRKLSLGILLNSDFEGGRFEFFQNLEGNGAPQPKMNRGSVMIFPSWQTHRVTPVTKGIRYSLVAWCVGPPFV